MNTSTPKSTTNRARWAAIGAAVAVTLGAGGIGLVSATSPAGAGAYVPIEPCRAADTRPQADVNVGARTTPLGEQEIHIVNATDGQCAGVVPEKATGLQLNVTAVGATQASFLTVWGSGQRPNASSLNPAPGQPPVPNAVTTAVTDEGDFRVFNLAGNVHVIVDVVGYYTDHHHDDRYYTEFEIDQQLAARELWAVVDQDGTRDRGSNAILSSKLEGKGQYEVIFARDVAACAYTVTLGNVDTGIPPAGFSGVARRVGNPNGVYVMIRDAEGLPVDGSFHLDVSC